jgi:hypothetical protein
MRDNVRGDDACLCLAEAPHRLPFSPCAYKPCLAVLHPSLNINNKSTFHCFFTIPTVIIDSKKPHHPNMPQPKDPFSNRKGDLSPDEQEISGPKKAPRKELVDLDLEPDLQKVVVICMIDYYTRDGKAEKARGV